MAYCDALCMNNEFLEIWLFTSVARANISVFKQRMVPRELLHAAKSSCIIMKCQLSVPGWSVMSDGIYHFLTSFSVLQHVGNRFVAGLWQQPLDDFQYTTPASINWSINRKRREQGYTA